MNWLKKKVVKWVRDDWDSARSPSVGLGRDIVCEDIGLPSPLRFKVQKANGGTVIEVVNYDRKRDENNTTLHIIPDGEQDVAAAIGKIVTYELLKI
jgi:hypothetical protein